MRPIDIAEYLRQSGARRQRNVERDLVAALVKKGGQEVVIDRLRGLVSEVSGSKKAAARARRERRAARSRIPVVE